MDLTTIKQGMSALLQFGTDPLQALTVGWTCRCVVKVSRDAGASVYDETFVTLVNGVDDAGAPVTDAYFEKLMSETDSLAIPAGKYFMLFELRNAATGENTEKHRVFVVEPQGVL